MRIIRLHFILTLLTITLFGCNETDNLPGEIYGIVSEYGSAEAMRGVGVELYQNNSLLLRTTTYDDGHFEFVNLKPGAYQLQVDANGYELCTYNVIVESGRMARADMQVRRKEISITSMEVTNVTPNSATLKASINYDRALSYKECGFVYSNILSSPSIDDDSNITTRISITNSTKEFSTEISGLSTDYKYYARAYIIVDNRIIYSEVVWFVASYVTILEEVQIMVQNKDLSTACDWLTAEQLCNNSTFAGYDDWRLPTVEELITIYNNKNSIPGLDLEGIYWTNHYSVNIGYSVIDFKNGKKQSYNYYEQLHVRAVRNIK